MGSGYGEALPPIEEAAHTHLARLVEAGQYRPTVGRVIDFDEIPERLRDFVDRSVIGRTVARIAES